MNQDPARNWWGAAWVEKMERLAESRRFAEGEEYARTGRVAAIQFNGRTVTATVQGLQEPPYTVRISFDPFSAEQWTRLLAQVRDCGKLAKEISSGDLPLEIQTAFSRADLRFMPERFVDLHLECPCPDWLKPCKHLVAVWMRFAREFDREPFLVFALRGLKREEILALLYNRSPAGAPVPGKLEELEEEEEIPDAIIPVSLESLPADTEAFWSAPALPASPDSTERLLPDADIFDELRNWPELEPQFQQIYDAVYELASLVRS